MAEMTSITFPRYPLRYHLAGGYAARAPSVLVLSVSPEDTNGEIKRASVAASPIRALPSHTRSCPGEPE